MTTDLFAVRGSLAAAIARPLSVVRTDGGESPPPAAPGGSSHDGDAGVRHRVPLPRELRRLTVAMGSYLGIGEGGPARRAQFLDQLRNAIPVGADLSTVCAKYAMWLLDDRTYGVEITTTDGVTRSLAREVVHAMRWGTRGDATLGMRIRETAEMFFAQWNESRAVGEVAWQLMLDSDTIGDARAGHVDVVWVRRSAHFGRWLGHQSDFTRASTEYLLALIAEAPV